MAVSELRDEYLSADDVRRQQMERRYGRRNIQKLVEDSFSEDWISSNAKKCPQCAAHIQVNNLLTTMHAFSALTPLVEWQEGHPACKNFVVGCWRGYLSGVWCKRCRITVSGKLFTAIMPLFTKQRNW